MEQELRKCRICNEEKPVKEFIRIKYIKDGQEVHEKDNRTKNCCTGPCYDNEKRRLRSKLDNGYQAYQQQSECMRQQMISNVANGETDALWSSSDSSSSSNSSSSSGDSSNSSTNSSTSSSSDSSGSTNSAKNVYKIDPSTLMKKCSKKATETVVQFLIDAKRVYSNVPQQTEFVICTWDETSNSWCDRYLFSC